MRDAEALEVETFGAGKSEAATHTRNVTPWYPTTTAIPFAHNTRAHFFRAHPLPLFTATNGGRPRPKGALPTVSRQYEAVYIFESSLEDAAIQEKLTKYHAMLAATEEITVDHWGRRQLAYKIGRRDTGYYVVARFVADPKTLPEFERALKLDGGVIRYLITLYEHELGAPPISEEELALARRREEDDEDED